MFVLTSVSQLEGSLSQLRNVTVAPPMSSRRKLVAVPVLDILVAMSASCTVSPCVERVYWLVAATLLVKRKMLDGSKSAGSSSMLPCRTVLSGVPSLKPLRSAKV